MKSLHPLTYPINTSRQHILSTHPNLSPYHNLLPPSLPSPISFSSIRRCISIRQMGAQLPLPPPRPHPGTHRGTHVHPFVGTHHHHCPHRFTQTHTLSHLLQTSPSTKRQTRAYSNQSIRLIRGLVSCFTPFFGEFFCESGATFPGVFQQTWWDFRRVSFSALVY